MRIDNKYLSDQLSKALEAKTQAEKQSELLSSTLEELKNLCIAELFEIESRNTSLIYSIIESCKMNGLRPVKYKDNNIC